MWPLKQKICWKRSKNTATWGKLKGLECLSTLTAPSVTVPCYSSSSLGWSKGFFSLACPQFTLRHNDRRLHYPSSPPTSITRECWENKLTWTSLTSAARLTRGAATPCLLCWGWISITWEANVSLRGSENRFGRTFNNSLALPCGRQGKRHIQAWHKVSDQK